MVSGAPDFWLKGKYIELIDMIRRIEKVKEITEIGQLNIVDIINTIKTIDKIAEITEISEISGFGEVGTLTHFSKAATGDLITPTAGYRTKVLSAFFYTPNDITTELRFKNSGNVVLALPTIGAIGMNPFIYKKSLGAVDEVLELYMSAAGTVKGWVVTEEAYGTGTSHKKTVTETLGLADFVDTEYSPPTGEWVSPTGYNDPENEWSNEEDAYDGDEETRAYDYVETGEGHYLELTISAITCSKIRFLASISGVDSTGYILDVYKNGEWVNIAAEDWGTIGTNKQWFEHEFTAGTVTAMRIKYHQAGIDANTLYIWEAKFWKIT